MEWFLPFKEKPVINAIPIKVIQEFQEEEIKASAYLILSQVEPSIEPGKERMEIKAPESTLLAQVKTPEPVVSAPVSERKPPVEPVQDQIVKRPFDKPVLSLSTSSRQAEVEGIRVTKRSISQLPQIEEIFTPVQKKVEKQTEDEPLPESSLYLEKSRPNQQTMLKDETSELNYTVEPQPVINSPGTETMAKVTSVTPDPAKTDDKDNGTPGRVLQLDIESVGESSKSEEFLLFMVMVRKKIEEVKSYPRSAKRRGYEGTVTVKFKILPDGSVTDLELDKPAQRKILNRAARQAIQKAAPFKPRPKSLGNREVKLKIPIAFKLKNRNR